MSEEKTRVRGEAAVQVAFREAYPNLPLDWDALTGTAIAALERAGLLCSQGELRMDIADGLRRDAEGRVPGGQGTPEQVAAATALNDAADFVEAGF